MSVIEVTSRITHQWLERKRKHELASIIMANIDKIYLFASERRYQLRVELLACNHCGTHALGLVDMDGCGLRITNHKCTGAWTTTETFKVEVSQNELNLYDLLAQVATLNEVDPQLKEGQ